ALVLVTGVRARGGVAEPQCRRHVVGHGLNRSGKAAIARTHELAVPFLRGREPELHVDQRISRWFEHELHATMRGNRRRRLWRTTGARTGGGTRTGGSAPARTTGTAWWR